jgi:hypothetical protein
VKSAKSLVSKLSQKDHQKDASPEEEQGRTNEKVTERP